MRRGGAGQQEWIDGFEDCLSVLLLGEASRLDDGDTLVNFASVGRLEVVTPDGEPVWRIQTDMGTAFGFSEQLASLYPR